MHGKEFDLPPANDVIKPIALLYTLVHEREVVIIERVSPQQEHRFVGWDRCDQSSYSVAIIARS